MISEINKNSKMYGRFIKSTGPAITLLVLLVLSSCSNTENEGLLSFPGKSRLVTAFDSAYKNNFVVLVPESTTDMVACIDCHKGLKVNTQMRPLTQTHKDFIFNHPGFDKQNRWCYYCHHTSAFDKLTMEDGRIMDYKDSYMLCQQCHLQNYREWELGLHGRISGEWAGAKQAMSCVNCHNSHTPAIQARAPKNPPLKPDQKLITLK